MTSFRLNLPTDIPWRRICVSKDMVDPLACDDPRPPRWHSSLAAFRYDPAEEYQPYSDHISSYVKVIATIAPFQWNEPGASPTAGFLPEELQHEIEESFPCYGAVLQVTVGPIGSEQEHFTADSYPYF